jgi:predicted NAD/FAD-binding protein
MKKLIILLLIVAAGWFLLRDQPAHWPGIPAAAEPQQTAKLLPKAFLHEKYTVTPLARYSITAVVLSRDRYRFDDAAKLAPVDLALGWGSMSIADVINELSVSQSGRWYEYTYKNEAPLDPQDIARHSANTHCLPADSAVRKQLLAVRRHDLVTLEGYLVAITTAEGFHWRSSLTRDDTGGGACEVMWVTSVTRKPL